ncbi:MAG TPA: hypothetical protein VHF27_11230 [Acidimicrobiales bacterium]|nr:hypothetical protein [Acidimicrobiales bacterium]
MPEPVARNTDPSAPPVPRDLAEDEPDLPSDRELGDLEPPLPDLGTAPAAPMVPVPPGPETPVSPLAEAGGAVPDTSLEEMAEAVEEGRLPD